MLCYTYIAHLVRLHFSLVGMSWRVSGVSVSFGQFPSPIPMGLLLCHFSYIFNKMVLCLRESLLNTSDKMQGHSILSFVPFNTGIKKKQTLLSTVPCHD